jgi:predicted SprT family Zn-dependent metalloprotease
VIRINPNFADEADLANTIAHELRHARDFQKGRTSPEGPAYQSGNALEEWINGRR